MSETTVSLDSETASNLVTKEPPEDLTDSQQDNLTNNLEIERKFQDFAIALSALQSNPQASQEMILKALIARDYLQKALSNEDVKSVELLTKLSVLDEQLMRLGEAIATGLHLPQWRKILHPPETNWWWFFEVVKPIAKPEGWDQLDWLFNLLTILCLTGTVSFVSKIIPIIFAGGMSLFESVGLLGPSGMVALVLSSMGGGQGQKKLQEAMAKLGISPKFQSEVTFVIAFLLFTGAYFFSENLPKYYFKHYISEGERLYKDGKLPEARDNFNHALGIKDQDPTDIGKVYVGIGLLEESLGNNVEAVKSYTHALELGNYAVLNNLGRVKISQNELDAAEMYLNVGLQRVDANDINIRYQLHRNLGWVNLEKKRYAMAEMNLVQAIEFDKRIPKGNLGKGMANCFKARLYEIQEKAEKATNQWNLCLEFGKPETLNEYQSILKLNPEVGARLDSTGIFN